MLIYELAQYSSNVKSNNPRKMNTIVKDKKYSLHFVKNEHLYLVVKMTYLIKYFLRN